MQRFLELAPDIAVMEATFLVLWASRYAFLARQGSSHATNFGLIMLVIALESAASAK